MIGKLGCIHKPPPIQIKGLHERANLALMQPPPSADWFSKSHPTGDMLGNDKYGNCVAVAKAITVALRRANAWGDTRYPDTDFALKIYSEDTGFDPATGLPDNGTDTNIAMQNWCTKGIWLDPQTDDIPLWVTVNPMELDHIRIAIAHTGPVQISLNLPTAAEDLSVWCNTPQQGADWEAGSLGGHRVVAGGYFGDFFAVRTWGVDVMLHPDFLKAYALGVDATLSTQWFDQTGLAPSGLDREALLADMQALAA